VKSWAEISEKRLSDNYRVLVQAAGGTAVLAVVKANGYGHGAEVCAPVLARAGARWLGVTDVAEGCSVREALAAQGIARERQPEILVMSGLLGEDADAAIRHGLTAVVWDRRQMEWLMGARLRLEKRPQLGNRPQLEKTDAVPVHLEIDTGMARQGVVPGDDLIELLRWMKGQVGLRLDGVMTHFASTEMAESSQTLAQRGLFETAVGAVVDAGLRPVWVHAGNSSTVDNQDTEGNLAWLRGLAGSIGARSMVRSGLGLYGYCLPIEVADAGILSGLVSGILSGASASSVVRSRVRPVMTWKTRVIGVREVRAGDTVGYNATFSAPRPMRLALLPVGYADGLRRELSGSNGHAGGWATVRGLRAAIVGRVSMNLTTVDVSEIDGVQVGDEVVVLGDGVTADDHAAIAHTIPYEIVCGVRAVPHLVPGEDGSENLFKN
jgi:alanine racemase